MREPLPVVLIPGLLCSPRLFAEQVPALWRSGPVTVADHTRDDTIAAIARRILTTAPPRFALAGLSMGGYIALEIMRQAPARVVKLGLLDTSARADTPEQSQLRRALIAATESGRFAEIPDQLYPRLVHPDRLDDEALRRTMRPMADETGPEVFIRQQRAILGRPDSRASAADIRCPTLVLVGDSDQIAPPEVAAELASIIAGAQLVTVPACGHMSTLERPDEVTRAMVEWMEGPPDADRQ